MIVGGMECGMDGGVVLVPTVPGLAPGVSLCTGSRPGFLYARAPGRSLWAVPGLVAGVPYKRDSGLTAEKWNS